MPYTQRDQDYEEPLAKPSAMWADLYALTMAQALFLEDRHTQQSTFHAFIRKTPFNASYLVTAGQNIVSEWLDKNWKFTDRDIRRLASKTVLNGKTGEQAPIFKPEFLEMLKNAKLELSLDMMPEGELAFSSEPIYKVSGPVWQCLAVEAAILNTMNSQSNFATYASILKTAANGKPVAEFGLRRAQGVGGLESTRGAFVGGADASSNCWAETNYGIPTIGTMAHAYVMIHETILI
jgi:nicotinate phosphoribosyltransferase